MLSKRTLVNITFFLCFFPFVRILRLHSVETEPIAGIIGLLIILLYGIKRNIFSITLIWLMFVITGYCAISIILRPSLFPSIILHTIAYFIPLFVFLSLYDKMDLLSPKVYFVALFIWLAVGVVQYFSLFGFLKPILNDVLGIFISRYASSPLGGARGVVFLGPEPSASSTSIILFMLTALFFYATRKISSVVMWLAVCASLFMLFLNKSGTGMLLFVLIPLGFLGGYLAVFVRGLKSFSLPRETIYVPFCAGLILVVVWFAAVLLQRQYSYRSRFSDSATAAFDRIVVQRDVSMHTWTRLGGFRVPALYVGYRSLGQNYGLGRGVGSWLTDFDQVARSCGVFLENLPLLERERNLKVVKPGAYGGTLAFDVGAIGLFVLLLFLSLFLVSKFKTKLPPSVSGPMWCIFFVSALKILFMGLVTLPMPWLGLCYVYHIKSSGLSRPKRG